MSVVAAETLHALRRAVADLSPQPGEEGRLISLGVPSLDQALCGGLACGVLHEISPAHPLHGGAATGFVLALLALAIGGSGNGAGQALWRQETDGKRRVGTAAEGFAIDSPPSFRHAHADAAWAGTAALGSGGGGGSGSGARQAVWIQPDFTAAEAGALYGPGLDLIGLPMECLVILRAPHPRDALWAMEEALKCRAAAAVVAELAGADSDLTATRRLALAAQEGGGLGLILCRNDCTRPSTAMTRWEVASARGERDRFGGLGPATFALSLVKNRCGRTGQWHLSWNHHERAFAVAALPLPVAPAAGDGSPARPLVRAG